MIIIDECYMSVVNKLTKQGRIEQISANLRMLDKNHDKVLFVYNIVKELNDFPTVQEVTKNADVSVFYRNQGNEYYKKLDYFKAWQYYNLSLLHAPLNSESFCLALSNRSIIFYYLNKYDECLKDINMVYTLNYPDSLKEKLTTRQKMCEKTLLVKKNVKDIAEPQIRDILTLKGERNSTYLCASSKLEVLHAEDMGRHVVAKENIKVGEVIVQEDPYFTLLMKTQILFSCSYCISRVLNLIPCDSCCFAFYCSEECKRKAFKEYHEVECPLMATLIDMEFTKLELIALRILIKARNDHTDWNDLFKTIEEAEKKMYTKYHGQVNINGKWIYDSKYYAAHHTLATNVSKRSVSDIFQKSITAVVFLRFLSENTKFLDANNNEDVEKIRQCVAGTLLLHMMTSPTNMHSVSSNIGDENGNYEEEFNIASASYAFHSLINHSCAPNVVRSNNLDTGRMSLLALRPIKKGMQLFDNYGMHHAIDDRVSRHSSLKFQYKFVCSCEACVDNWPTYACLTPSTIIPQNMKLLKNKLLGGNVIKHLQKGDRKTALRVYEQLCRLCENLESFAPCMELCDCQEAMKQCLVIFQGLIPFGHSQTVKLSAVSPTLLK